MKSIRAKLIFWICILFIFMGALIYLPLSIILPKKITAQILKRDVEIARYLSEESEGLLLLNDRISLSLLLHDNVNRLEDAQYLFVQDADGDVISHTFVEGFPKALLSLGPNPTSPHNIKEFLSNGRRIYDISIPILKGEVGTLHLGVSMESGKKDIAEFTKINSYIALIILIGLGIGILVFLTIGLLFSNEIIRLKNFASEIGKGNLDAKIDVKSDDEIGALTSTFNEMVLRLKDKIQEIKRLNTVEERNRIALDLHDGCAQDMANIIKRLELCEKLFRRDPQKGFEELAVLKKNTKEVLARTREAIFDLKSPEDTAFNLRDKINSYMKDYQEQNDIKIKLNVAEAINNFSSDKSKSIFYIITEALTNARKHSQAKNVELNFKTDNNGNLMINIKDDGKGFDVDGTLRNVSICGRWGLIGMRERVCSLGGRFSIKSEPQQGTRVSIDIPLAKTVT